jgi:hypothetical protein
MRRVGGVVLAVTGLLACPCHLIVPVPWLASGLSGTALGSFLIRTTGLVFTFASVYFIVALALEALFLLGPKHPSRRVDAACPTCVPVEAETRVQERSPMPDNLPATRR